MTEVWQQLEHLAVMMELAGLEEQASRARAAAQVADQDPERAAEVLRELSAEVRALAPVFSTARRNPRFR
jgi:hypothetical protein